LPASYYQKPKLRLPVSITESVITQLYPENDWQFWPHAQNQTYMDKTMRRIYFLAPDIKIAHLVVDELRTEGITDRNLHILAKRDTPLGDLPEASELQKTDFIPALERGAALGATTGLLAGLVGLRFAGFAIAGGPVLGILFYGATIGMMMSGLAGLGVGNSKVKKYVEAIERGEILVMVDIPKDRIETISQLITKHHPSAQFEGIEPLLPPNYV